MYFYLYPNPLNLDHCTWPRAQPKQHFRWELWMDPWPPDHGQERNRPQDLREAGRCWVFLLEVTFTSPGNEAKLHFSIKNHINCISYSLFSGASIRAAKSLLDQCRRFGQSHSFWTPLIFIYFCFLKLSETFPQSTLCLWKEFYRLKDTLFVLDEE